MPFGGDLVGSNVALSCRVNRSGTENMLKIFWSGPVDSQSMIGLSSTLSLDPLRAANAGTYMCHASFESVTGNESINVTATCKNYKFVCYRTTTLLLLTLFSGHGANTDHEYN